MTNSSESPKSFPKLIHIGRILKKGENLKYLYLRKIDPHTFTWFLQEGEKDEIHTNICAESAEEAIRLATRQWSDDFFCPIGCGFRYTLPERDEHGINALFHQMAASYSTSNGVYFDEELGSNCFVQFASQEACKLLKQLMKQNRL